MGNKETIRKAKYDSEHCRIYKLKLNRKTDSELIEALSEKQSIQGYIKSLIRNDIESHKEA